MAEAPDLRSAFEAAEQAAAAGDYLAAERHLSGAASQQEASLGPLHPDLANTLNNLGVVYETIDRPDDAERCYRRAYSIALAALDADHPFVATSEKNLRDFCNVRGKPFELPVPLPALELTPEPLDVWDLETPQERPVTSATRLRAAGVMGAVAIGALIAWRLLPSPSGPAESVQEAAPPPPIETPAPIPEPAPPAPAPTPVEPIPAAPQKPTLPERPVAVSGNRRAAPPVAASPVSAPLTLVEANLCDGLSSRDWQCDQVSDSVEPGQLFFYTRLKSSANTTVEHRWYHSNRLHRRVVLRVQANPIGGYRTYSRTAVTAGEWRVEARTRDGAVLNEETFVVR